MKNVLLALALILTTPMMSACAATNADTGGWTDTSASQDTSYSPPPVDTSWVDRQNAEDQQRFWDQQQAAQQQQEDNQRMWDQIYQQQAQQNLQVFQ
jgi:hypothetical protein